MFSFSKKVCLHTVRACLFAIFAFKCSGSTRYRTQDRFIMYWRINKRKTSIYWLLKIVQWKNTVLCSCHAALCYHVLFSLIVWLWCKLLSYTFDQKWPIVSQRGHLFSAASHICFSTVYESQALCSWAAWKHSACCMLTSPINMPCVYACVSGRTCLDRCVFAPEGKLIIFISVFALPFCGVWLWVWFALG